MPKSKTPRKPKKTAWKPGSVALEAIVEWTYDAEQLSAHIADVPVARMLRLDLAHPQRMKIVVTARSWKLDLESDTIFGAGFSLVRHDDGRATWLHHDTKTRLELPKAEIPRARAGRPGRWRVVTDECEPSRERRQTDLSVELEDPGTGRRWIQRIRCGPPLDQPELARRLFEALSGGSPVHATTGYPLDQLAQLVASAGMPLEVSVRAADGDQTVPISSYRITDVRVRAMIDADRGVAGTYADLRTRKARDRWSKPGPGRAEPIARDLDDMRPDGPAAKGKPRMRDRDDDGPDREPPDREPPDGDPPDRPPRGSATITTSSAQVALRIEQRLLDDVQRAVNSVAAHLTGASTSGTDVVIPWLEQIVASARALDPTNTKVVPGTGLAAILHEDPRGAAIKAVVGGGGRGVLDRMAVKQATAYFTAGAVPPDVLARQTPADRGAIMVALTVTPAATRFASLPAAIRSRFVTSILFDSIGTVRLSLAKLRDPINVQDLYWMLLTNFQVALGVPSVPAATTTPAPPIESPFLSLRCRASGSIDGSLMFSGLGVDATIIRTGTPQFWALLVAGGPLIPIFFPQFAWVIPILWTVATFLLTDVARVRLDARPLSLVFTVRFLPTTTSAALRPSVSARLIGSIRTRMLSYFPDGLHQVIDWSLAELANTFAITLTILEGQMAQQIESALRTQMGDGVPATLLQLGIPVASGQAFGEDDKYVYLESTLGTPAIPEQRITPVPVSAALRFDLDRDITRVFGAGAGRGRHYVSVGASVNAINQVAAVLWWRRAFNQFVSAQSAAGLRPLLVAPFTGPVSRIDVSHDAAPVFALPPMNPTDSKRVFDVTFPSVAIRVTQNPSGHWLFRYRILARGAFGFGGVPQNMRFLAWPGPGVPMYQPMIDMSSLAVIPLDVTEFTKTTITVQDSGEDARHPERVTTHHETIETSTDRTAVAAPQWSQYALGVFKMANWFRDVNFIPRHDGLKGNGSQSPWPLDSPAAHTYGFDGGDPDDATAALLGMTSAYASAPVDWGFVQGLALTHLQVDGAARQILSGTPHLNSFMTVDGELLWPFLTTLFP